MTKAHGEDAQCERLRGAKKLCRVRSRPLSRGFAMELLPRFSRDFTLLLLRIEIMDGVGCSRVYVKQDVYDWCW